MIRPASALPTILIVDDEPMIRQLIGCFLRSRQLTTVEAGNGAEALQMVRAENLRPDLVIVDLIMPVLGGLGLLEELRREQADLPALIVSGCCDDPVALNASINDRTHFLGKPFNFKMLEVEINRLLPIKTPSGDPSRGDGSQ